MLEKPQMEDGKIIDCLLNNYGLNIVQVRFLPLGADVNTAVYRATATDFTPYFVKLRREEFNDISVIVPKLLHDQGVEQVIAPYSTQTQQLWANLGDFRLMVFPFVEGHSGFEVDLTDQQWIDFGRALKHIHRAAVPQAILDRIPRETFSPYWRERVREFQQQVETQTFDEPVAARLAAFLKSKKAEISHMINRAEELAAVLQRQSLDYILCHADIHVGNVLTDSTNDTLYVVDWDTLTLAPKERDLMFIGGGLGGGGHTADEEETLFYQGYGQTEINPVALAYYRYERIVQDIAAYCEQLLLTDEGGEDREEGLRQLTGQFLPNEVVDLAYRTDRNLSKRER